MVAPPGDRHADASTTPKTQTLVRPLRRIPPRYHLFSTVPSAATPAPPHRRRQPSPACPRHGNRRPPHKLSHRRLLLTPARCPRHHPPDSTRHHRRETTARRQLQLAGPPRPPMKTPTVFDLLLRSPIHRGRASQSPLPPRNGGNARRTRRLILPPPTEAHCEKPYTVSGGAPIAQPPHCAVMLSTAIRSLHRRLSSTPTPLISALRAFSTPGGGSGDGSGGWNDEAWGGGGGGGVGGDAGDPGLGWGDEPSWSTGLTKDHFDGNAVGRRVSPEAEAAIAVAKSIDEEDDLIGALEKDNRESKAFVDSWEDRMMETYQLLQQVREPGVRGSYLKDSEKAEMYKLHKENPEEYTVERLAKDYRVMRQRVHAILWLKEMEEEEEKKRGRPLDDSVEILLDQFPEFFISHDREFHVAGLPYKPEFKVMPEGWDGTTRDPDEVLYEISMKEDEMLYEEFLLKLKFNKMKVAGLVKKHKYSRRRPDEGWNITVEKLGPRAKRGGGGGLKFVSLPDGSSRPLNEVEKVYVKRETPKRRKRIIAPFKL